MDRAKPIYIRTSKAELDKAVPEGWCQSRDHDAADRSDWDDGGNIY